MDEKKELRFEQPEKPEIKDLKVISPITEEFDQPEKAEALIKNLKLSVGDTLIENDDYYTINSRMVLEGDSPEDYKDSIENLKKILTKQEIKVIDNYLKGRKNEKVRDKIYESIDKRTDKFYWRQEIKKSLSKDVKEVLEFFKEDKNCGLMNTIYHLLKKGKDLGDYVRCYILAWKNKPIPNIQEWRERNDGEYRVLTDSEADREANDYLKDDDGLWRQAVESGNTTDGLDEWAEAVLNCDGRGSVLNFYNGCEECEEVNGTDYYIYQTN